jgi:hypothetical protein
MKFRGLQRDPVRPVPAGDDQGDREARSHRHPTQLRRLATTGAHFHLDDLLTSYTARDEFLGQFEGAGDENRTRMTSLEGRGSGV